MVLLSAAANFSFSLTFTLEPSFHSLTGLSEVMRMRLSPLFRFSWIPLSPMVASWYLPVIGLYQMPCFSFTAKATVEAISLLVRLAMK